LKFRNIEKRFFPGTTAKGQPLEMVAEPRKERDREIQRDKETKRE
jgi:hypothetical protein